MSDLRLEYFATRQGADFTKGLMERINDFYTGLMTSKRLDLYRRLATARYMGYFRGGSLTKSGAQDEFTMIHANHFSNILGNMVTMTASSRPAFDPRAVNTDHKSKAQCIVARGVLDYYNRDKGMGETSEDCADSGVLFGEGESLAEWDAKAGDDYMADPNTPGGTIKQGDINFRTFGPVDCIRDLMLPSAKKMTWRIYRDFSDRWELAARYPEARDRIMALQVDASIMSNRWLSPWTWKTGDIVPWYTFYHDRTAAVPQGRCAIFIDDKGPLLDSPMPYKTFPGCRLAPSDQKGTPFGYSLSFDILPIQESIDMLASVVTTNQTTFGVQNVLIPNGANFALKQLADGLNALYYDSKFGEPKALNLVSTPKEIFDWIDYLVHWMETISGVNSVARGNPETSLKSGAALALVQSMAIQFNSNLQKAYARHIEANGTGVIQILSTFPKTKRMVEIAGKANRSYMKEFDAADMQSISRVSVDMGNPLARTTAGKVQMAEDLLGKGLVNADQYIQVLTTGNLDPIIEGKEAELMLISSENEDLADGKPAQVAVTDNHALHVQEHKSVLASPEARLDPNVVKATTDHITEHITMLQQLSASNPNLLIALGQQPVPPPPPPMAPPPAPGGPGAPAGGGAAPGPASAVLDATDPGLKAGAVKPAGLPTNPMTKQPAPGPLPPAAV